VSLPLLLLLLPCSSGCLLPGPLLQVPIAVQGRIVNWIDSKATFGDDKLHRWVSACACAVQVGTN
jgi:hypothetical protein